MNSNTSRTGSVVLAALLFLLIGIVLGGLFVPQLNVFDRVVATTDALQAQITESDIPVVQNLETPTTIVEAAIDRATEALPTAVEEVVIQEEIEVEVEVENVEAAPELEIAQSALTGFALEDRLVDLYDEINPSVVFIFAYTENLPLGSGSGFVYDTDGHIITNNHVIASADRYEILFPNGFRTEATLTGADVDADVAVLRADTLPEGANPIPFGSSSDLQVGQFVVAIGNPFGNQSSMSLGIVSAVGRSLPSDRTIEGGGRYSLPDAIQIDAPINPGNSGGPLLTLAGEVVGINARIFSESGVNSGVGFSIPIDIVARMIPSLIAEGSYTYPFLGVSIYQSIDLRAQEAFGLPQTNGAYVTSVSEGGPAAEAGLIPANPADGTGGDLIVAINNETVNSFEDLISYLYRNVEIGQTVTLTVLRGGDAIEVPLTVSPRP